MNIALFLDEVTAANGPLLLLPQSHEYGVSRPVDLEPALSSRRVPIIKMLTSRPSRPRHPLWTLEPRDGWTKLSAGVDRLGAAGSMLVRAPRNSSLLAHASPPNNQPSSGVHRLSFALPRGQPHVRKFL